MPKLKVPTVQTFLDFLVLWVVMVALIRFVPLPMQLKSWLVPKSA